MEGAVPSVSNSTLGNDDTLAVAARAGLVRVNGASQLHEAKQWTASEHRALFAEALPSVYFFVRATPKVQDAATAQANHSPKFYVDEDALRVGMQSLLQAGLDYLNATDS